MVIGNKMLDKTTTLPFINRATTRSLHGQIEKDIEVINHRLIRAEIFLSQLEGVNFQALAPGVPFNPHHAKISSRISRKFSAEFKFSTRQYYETYVVGLFFHFLGEINAAADVFGTSLDVIYESIRGSSYGVTPHFFEMLQRIKTDTVNGLRLTVFLNDPNHVALIDNSDMDHFLPVGHTGNVELRDCKFSYNLIRRIRNKQEHNSYEGLISFESQRDHMGVPEFYAAISDRADVLCNTTHNNIFQSLSKRKGGSRDLVDFSKWTLDKFSAYLTDMIGEVTNDM